ncbi:uncharacterized protein MEPE_05717 [Melanopsichium pennsylvanicum]|uniref:Uncharacterized protein n=1 Tax=Melanopsichium pennsylvanicum TaxID=63383 RepID=A0AAJ4XRG0_9BASI|nr:uncharacterized protein MEPE_05717 [Melanopsichium pennsylvanicum]
MTTITSAHADDETTHNLVKIGGKTVPNYLKGAFPETATLASANAPGSNPEPRSSSNSSSDASKDIVESAVVTIDEIMQDVLDGKKGAAAARNGTSKSTNRMVEMEKDEQKYIQDVPFYIKVRGKGKGKPVLFDQNNNAVAQIYELAAQMDLAEPLFTHTRTGAAFIVTVDFDNLTATNVDFAGSIKEGKEMACARLARMILKRNAHDHLYRRTT